MEKMFFCYGFWILLLELNRPVEARKGGIRMAAFGRVERAIK